MKIKPKDFIEIDFTAKTEDGRVFDTTLKEEAKKANLPESDYKSVSICVGEGQILKGLDKALEGKEIGKKYEITLEPEDAFGKRDSKLVKIIPIKVFIEKKVNPYPGLSLAIDNMIATVRAVGGGRVITDFNHPFAGRKVIYDVIAKKKLSGEQEKIGVLLKKYVRTDKFSVNAKSKEVLLEEQFPEGLLKEVEKKIKELIGDFSVKTKKKAEETGKKPEKLENQKTPNKKKV